MTPTLAANNSTAHTIVLPYPHVLVLANRYVESGTAQP